MGLKPHANPIKRELVAGEGGAGGGAGGGYGAGVDAEGGEHGDQDGIRDEYADGKGCGDTTDEDDGENHEPGLLADALDGCARQVSLSQLLGVVAVEISANVVKGDTCGWRYWRG